MRRAELILILAFGLLPLAVMAGMVVKFMGWAQ
jgi:hypothetical protein